MGKRVITKKSLKEEALKNYPRVFEKVYSPNAADPKWNKELDSLYFNGLNKDKGIELAKKLAKETEEVQWMLAIKASWLSQNVKAKNHSRMMGAHVLNKTVETRTPNSLRRGLPFSRLYSTAISQGAKKIIPDFLNKNPWEEPEHFEFPYKNISSTFLVPIYSLSVSIIEFLLERADKSKMTFAEYLDFVANFVFCYNNEREKDAYVLFLDSSGIFTVRKI